MATEFTFEVETLVGGASATEVVTQPLPPETWTIEDVEALLQLLCSFIRADRARFVYAFTPAADGAAFVVTVTVGKDGAVTEPLPLQQSVVEEMVSRSGVETFDPETFNEQFAEFVDGLMRLAKEHGLDARDGSEDCVAHAPRTPVPMNEPIFCALAELNAQRNLRRH